MSSTKILTRVLVISDTHGASVLQQNLHTSADVLIHCGDLSERSELPEFQNTLNLLKTIDAPLKLIIAGNHDWTLDPLIFAAKLKEAGLEADDERVIETYGTPGQTKKLLQSETASGIIYLDEGIHSFQLRNGAEVTVYASPYTPSVNEWGFQYDPSIGHEWKMDADSKIEIAITHGPPLGLLDQVGKKRAGCPGLFDAIARSQPQLHCFGHIHSAWGARRVAWKPNLAASDLLSHFTAIDNDHSAVLATLSKLGPQKYDSDKEKEAKEQACRANDERGFCLATLEQNRDRGSSPAKTLFVNSAVGGSNEDGLVKRLPWMVELLLPRSATESKKRKRDGEDDPVSKRDGGYGDGVPSLVASISD
jgi:Icc-related predicted phosphoesterase